MKQDELEDLETDTDLTGCSPAADVFIWENPLHKWEEEHNPSTPDEQIDLEYDGEILEDHNGVKSVTPIRLFKCPSR